MTLLRIADDPTGHWEVREHAVDALCAFQAPEGIEVIGRALLDPESTEGRGEYLAFVLGEIGNSRRLSRSRRRPRGTRTPCTDPVLERASCSAYRDPEGWVGRCALERIERIRRG